ncbi:hypothetical protein [uncultured Brevibacillus sp.]|uniref:hypothetical protein n=1 Tax=uncultured Brevibacillus sp. TaxID=169970 RepID=UPI00259AE92B|nr:hypothetical protein [uncultured Brevibacillus sp.]
MSSLNQSSHRSGQDRYKIVLIPAELLDIVKEKLGDEFIWDYDEKSQELFLMKRPESYTDFLSGLGKEMWSSAGGEEHIHGERSSWND